MSADGRAFNVIGSRTLRITRMTTMMFMMMMIARRIMRPFIARSSEQLVDCDW